MSEPTESQVLWRLNQRCNFRCGYCFRQGVDVHRGEEHPDCGRHSPEHVARSFDATGRSWRIHLTGGEPFLYPDFVALAAALTLRHRLSVNTNLTTPNAREFADRIPPGRIHSVNATLHLDEIERRGLLAEWLETFRYFQAKGFNIRLMYLTHPAWLGRMATDLARFRAEGVTRTYVKVFRGPWDGRHYPAAFTPAERGLILAAGPSGDERRILAGRVNFRGLGCAAGHTGFDMDLRGNLTRCSGVPGAAHGNLFEGTFRPAPAAAPCPAATCLCPYQGMRFVAKNWANRCRSQLARLGRASARLWSR